MPVSAELPFPDGLDLRDDAAEIGNEAAEHAGLVHRPQDRFRVTRAGQHVHEERIGALVAAHGGIDQPQVAARLLSALKSWRVLEPTRRALARAALRRVAAAPTLSRDVHDITARALGDDAAEAET